MNLERILNLGLVAAFLLSAIALACTCCGRHVFTKKELTEETLRRCEWIEANFTRDTGSDLESYLRTKEADGYSLAQVFNWMVSYPQHIPASSIPTNMASLTDAWARPLNFIWSRDAVAHGLSEKLRNKGLPVIVWSSGENGANEFGGGDDVMIKAK